MSILTSITRSWLTRSIKPFHFVSSYDDSLSFKATDKLGLYIHIPFCRSLCSFCPYCKVVYQEDLAKRYIEALLKEIEIVGRMGGPKKKEVTSLYFGGGTPALLADYINDIILKVKDYFVITDGIGLELHPEDVTIEKLIMLKSAGVTKISIGIQSFQQEHVSLLGREPVDAAAMFRALQQVSFETVSMDFIFAIPGQSFQSVKKDIETAFSNGANHIALYPFIDFTFTNANMEKMKNKEKKQLLYDIVGYCERMGYTRDSIWTFSKLGNSKYSSMTRENFLGFGCSATTLLKEQFKINTFNPEEYIRRVQQKKLPTALTLKFTMRQRMVYYLFWTAYSMRVNPDDFKSFFGRSLVRSYGFELAVARMMGFIKKQDGHYVMTTKGSYYYHYYEGYYTLSYIDQMWSFMGKEAFPKELIIK